MNFKKQGFTKGSKWLRRSIILSMMAGMLVNGTALAIDSGEKEYPAEFTMAINGKDQNTQYTDLGIVIRTPSSYSWMPDVVKYTFDRDVVIAPTKEASEQGGSYVGGLGGLAAIYLGNGEVDAGDYKITIRQENTAYNVSGITADTQDMTVKAGEIDMKLSTSREGGQSRNAVGIYHERSNRLNVKGDVTMDVNATGNSYGIWSNDRGTINVDGVKIKMNKDAYRGASIYAANANVNVNMEGGQPGSHTVQLDGDIRTSASRGAHNNSKATVNLAMTDSDSYLNGILSYEDTSNDEGIYPQNVSGTVNMYLRNGATWTNEKYSDNDYLENFRGSKVTKLAGGDDEASAGVIHQKDAKDILVGDYSGHTVVVYDHDAAAPATFTAGDVKIDKAAADSSILLRTGRDGVTESNMDEVFGALAGKLYYLDAMNGARLLNGKLEIAEGLTASSASKDIGGMEFDAADGRGKYVKVEKPGGTEDPDQPADSGKVFTTGITGNASDEAYVNAGIRQADGTYKFTRDTTITAASPIRSDYVEYTVDASGHALTLAPEATTGNLVAISANSPGAGFVPFPRPHFNPPSNLTVKADTLNINLKSTDGSATAVLREDAEGLMNLEGDVKIDVQAKEQAHGLKARNKGIINVTNLDVTVNRDARDSAAVFADEGTVNVNMDGGKAGSGIVTINGDIKSVHHIWSPNTANNAEVNLGLSNDQSRWTGIVASGSNLNDEGIYPQDGYGRMNLFLENGGQWINEKHSDNAYPGGYEGSYLTRLTGGATAEKAGVIHQKDAKAITVDQYSGHTVVVYDHRAGSPATFSAGDFIVKKAAEGSAVTLRTGRDGITADNQAEVLEALAHKLYYKAVKDGEANLSGKVEIAEGLTASSVAQYVNDVRFKKGSGQGYVNEAGPDTPGTEDPVGPRFDYNTPHHRHQSRQALYQGRSAPG